MRRRTVAFLVAVGLLAASCSSTDDPVDTASPTEAATERPTATADVEDAPVADAAAPAPDPATDSDGDEPTAETDAAYRSGDSSLIFAQDQLHTFDLDLAPELLAEIDADPTAEEYVEGTLTFEGETLPVGIRYKGSIGAFVNCVSGSDIFQPSGEKTCTKLSMKVKINWNDTDDTFYGLKKLQFHSQNLDPSMMHERLGYWLFREMGVPAPRSVHARLVINGEFVGLFALTEQIDGRFTRQNFDDGSGNLYKEIWPVSPSGDPFPDDVYLDALETNEDEDPTAEAIRGFGTALADAAPEDVPALLENWLDIDRMLAYAAVDRTIANDDGVMHFYCPNSEWCTSHNYYWYEDPTTARLHLIPWDLDNAFENISRRSNPVTPIADGWGEISNDCDPFKAPGGWIDQRSAACDPIFGGLASFDERHEAQLDAFLSGPFSAERVDAQLDTWAAQIAEVVAEADAAHPDAVSPERWQSALDTLRTDIETARTRAAGG